VVQQPDDPRTPAERSGADVDAWDACEAAVARLEEHVLSLPYDRALPGLDELLAGAGVSHDLLWQDERARKTLHEAILARPLSTLGVVADRSAEVELLVLEVQVLTQTLRSVARRTGDASRQPEATRAALRLTWIRGRLHELRAEL
jgi:hypothetical protein